MRVIRSRSPGLLFARDAKRARAMPCAETRQDRILFFVAQRFFLKIFHDENRKWKWKMGSRPILFSILHFRSSDLVILDPRGFTAILCDVNHEVGEEAERFTLEETQDRDGAAPDFQLGTLARTEFEHRSPSAGIPRDDDLRLRGVG